jgi:hypothetical protein
MANQLPADPAEALAQQAQHECGHAAASWALGIPFQRIVLNSPHGPRIDPVPGGVKILVGQHWLIQACGAIADYQRRGLTMRGSQIARLLLGGDSDIFEVDDPATGQVAIRPSRAPAVQPGGDLHHMVTKFAQERATPDQVIPLWRSWEQFAAAIRPAIDALAAELPVRGELSYDEACKVATAAMDGHPAPVIPATARRE